MHDAAENLGSIRSLRNDIPFLYRPGFAIPPTAAHLPRAPCAFDSIRNRTKAEFDRTFLLRKHRNGFFRAQPANSCSLDDWLVMWLYFRNLEAGHHEAIWMVSVSQFRNANTILADQRCDTRKGNVQPICF